MLHATTVSTEQDMLDILALQQLNLKDSLPDNEMKEQGFVTMKFSLNMLEALNRLSPSIILKNDKQLVGYAIVFLIEGIDHYPAMRPLLEKISNTSWRGRILQESPYYIMGQICVAREARGKGAFELLYHKHRELLQNQYKYVITSISESNERSLRVHERVGFKVASSFADSIDRWNLMVWDWT